jgi:hypothetical protein
MRGDGMMKKEVPTDEDFAEAIKDLNADELLRILEYIKLLTGDAE